MMDGHTTDALPEQKSSRGGILTRDAWLCAAKEIFILGGISALSVRGLAASLGVTPGAFYWQFRSLEDLLEDLRNDWAETNTRPFQNAIEQAGPNGMMQYLAWVSVLISEAEFRPEYDNVIRDWARRSAKTAEVLHRTEAQRIDQLRDVFVALGYAGHSAEIRARVAYFHQAGYNAMGIRESLETRINNIPFFAEVLTGQDARAALQSPQWQETISRISQSS